jgi:sigma-B regulation protein RsbU (phosphoserine phosphatase)
MRIDEQMGQLRTIMIAVGGAAVVLAAVICYLVAWIVTTPVHTLVRDMDRVSQGDLSHQTRAHSSDEIGAIAMQFNEMTRKLAIAQEAQRENQRYEDELEMAREIQIKLLPPKLPHIRGLDIFATYHPAKEVGGDYYDLFPIDKEHLGIIVADVSGKGIPGSMVMATTRTILRFVAVRNTSAASTLARTNQVVAADIRRGMFVTAFYLVLNVRNHQMCAASAGHNPMAVYRASSGEVELVNPSGIALGFDKGPLFEKTIKDQSMPLNPGDRAVLYTDGVVEAMNEQSEEYSDERFYDFVRDNSEASSEDFVKGLLADLEDHKGRAEQHDDITIVTFRAG